MGNLGKLSADSITDTLVKACPNLSAEFRAKHSVHDAARDDYTDKGLDITPEAVSGNMFLSILAGHESSAHTLSIVLMLLAFRPEIQCALQSELDAIFEARSIKEWSYKGDCSALLQGYTGAVVYETFRVWPMQPAILKSTEDKDKTISINERSHVVGKNTLILLHTTGAQIHPSYWDASASNEPFPGESCPYPLSSFNPDRWLTARDNESQNGEAWMDQMRSLSERKQRLRLAKPGTFFPFSEGGSACLGNHMALVEVVAAIAAICKQWTVRLPTEEGKSWDQLRSDAARKLTAGMSFHATLHVSEPVALEFVPRDIGEQLYRSAFSPRQIEANMPLR